MHNHQRLMKPGIRCRRCGMTISVAELDSSECSTCAEPIYKAELIELGEVPSVQQKPVKKSPVSKTPVKKAAVPNAPVSKDPVNIAPAKVRLMIADTPREEVAVTAVKKPCGNCGYSLRGVLLKLKRCWNCGCELHRSDREPQSRA